MSELYNKIEFLCSEKKISKGKLCNDLGLHRSMLSDLKMGRKSTLSIETVLKIANYFGVTVDYLLGVKPAHAVDPNETDAEREKRLGLPEGALSKAAKEKAPTEPGERTVSDEDIMFALFNGADDITDEMFEEVKRFAQFIQERDRNKPK